MIEVRKLSKEIADKKVIDHVSICIGEKEVFLITGSDNAGKTTLLSMLAGVMKADAGTIVVDNKPIYDNPVTKEIVFYIPDKTYFLRCARVQDIAVHFSTMYSEYDSHLFVDLCKKFDIDLNKKVRSYPENINKIITFINAVASNPKYLLLDGTLDDLGEYEEQVIEVLHDMLAERYITLVIATDKADYIKTLLADSIAEAGYETKQYSLD